MKKLVLGALLCLASTARAQPAPAYQDALGVAPINNGNTRAAHEQALADALRQALVKGAGALIDTASVVEGGTLVQDRIYAHAQGYIKSYEVGRDGPASDDPGTWEVAINHAVVSTGELARDMEAIHAMLVARAHPRLYVLVREQAIEQAYAGAKDDKGVPSMAQLSQGISLHRFEEQLTHVGWKFVDPEVASGKVHVQNAMSTDLAALNGQDFSTTGADYVVLGSVITRPIASGPGGQLMEGTHLVEVRAVVKIKATDTGETVASVELSKTLPGLSAIQASRELLEQAGDAIAAEISGKVLKRWNADANGVGSVHLWVTVSDYDVLQAFEDQVEKGVANVKAVKEVSFADGRGDLSVMLAGTSTRQLAGALSGKSVKGLAIKVSKVTENTVEVKLVK